jgi:hypothetical protein
MFYSRPEPASVMLPPHARYPMHLDSLAGASSHASSARNLTQGDARPAGSAP